MRKAPIPILLLIAFVLIGCNKNVPVPVSNDDLVVKIEKMAQSGFVLLPTLSISGRIKISAKAGRGSVGMILLYDPNAGLRMDLVDPIFRPVLSMIAKDQTLWVYDPRINKTVFGPMEMMVEKITGFAIGGSDFMPLLFGRIPVGDFTASLAVNCHADDDIACFDLKDKGGAKQMEIGINNATGALSRIIISNSETGKNLILAEFSNDNNEIIPRKVRISNLETNDFVVLRYTDVVSGDSLEAVRFDPTTLGE